MSFKVKTFANTAVDDDIAECEGNYDYEYDEKTLPPGIRNTNELFEEHQSTEMYQGLIENSLPTAFDGGMDVKGFKRGSYYCDICLTELNSEDTMRSHANGQKHLKKVNAAIMKNNRDGEIVDPNSYIRTCAPTKMAPKKIPTRLCIKLGETGQPIVGLRYITEIISVTNVEMEPQYECTLCNNQGEANGMFSHLLGRGHQEKFFMKIHDVAKAHFSPSQLKDMAEKARENNHTNWIDTIYSDDLYRWPSGKAPWSVEQGGTGVAPTYARDLARLKAGGGLIMLTSDTDGGANRRKADIHVKGLPPINSPQAVDVGLDTIVKILYEVTAFQNQNASDLQTKNDVEVIRDLVLSNIEVLRGLTPDPNLYTTRPSPLDLNNVYPTPSRRT